MTDKATIAELQAMVRTLPDFPKPGIQFRDITTLISNGRGLSSAVAHLAELARADEPQLIAGMEARGFIFGAAVAAALGVGFLPIRKPGKLPVPTIGVDYALEYGTDRLEIDPDAISANMRVTIVDDLIATGGTALATVQLLRNAGADVRQALFVIDLPDLGGASKLRDADIATQSLMHFNGD
ncbi:adenine phosphoribosyltransferase [Parasphingorhabdus sp. DH2-15]|uniref:adenine phosphoribosyltransferase n=1 Tax=Parasphingorhabdus sp. DH2-15 TaxID=3444112 RepID=UPI003F68345D